MGISTHHPAAPATYDYFFFQFLPVKVYLTFLAEALLTSNRLEGARQSLIIARYAEYSFSYSHILPCFFSTQHHCFRHSFNGIVSRKVSSLIISLLTTPLLKSYNALLLNTKKKTSNATTMTAPIIPPSRGQLMTAAGATTVKLPLNPSTVTL